MGIEDTLIAYWNKDSYQLGMWDTGKTDSRGQTRIAYKFWHKGELIFEGRDFSGSPLHADDAPQTIAALLHFISLRPGDTDADYFKDYTEKQMTWARNYGEDLGMVVNELERS